MTHTTVTSDGNKLLHVSRTIICSRSHVKTQNKITKTTTRMLRKLKLLLFFSCWWITINIVYLMKAAWDVYWYLLTQHKRMTRQMSAIDADRRTKAARVTLFKQPPSNKRLCYGQLVCLGGSQRIFVLKPASFYLSITVKFSLVLTVFQMQTAFYK